MAADVLPKVEKMKLEHTMTYMVFGFDDKETLVIEKEKQKGATWDDFIADLPAAEPRFAIFDVEYTNADKMQRKYMVFIYWVPDNAKIFTKVKYATAKAKFHKDTQVTR